MTRFFRFLVPSVFGAGFFLFPVWYEGIYTIPIAVLTDMLNDVLGDLLAPLGIELVLISA